MTRKVALVLTLLLVATGTNALACGTSRSSRAVTAGRDPILSSYERARRALIDGSVAKVQKAANEIAAAAHEAEEHAIAERSADLRDARDLAAARQAFAALSDVVIQYYETSGGDRLGIAYCDIEKKLWLQPTGRIGNPYVDRDRRRCGEFVDSDTELTDRSAARHR
ncbi:MAG: hypothetical protein ACYC60_21935 [Thermoanaerobaculia bacterium]